MHRTGDAQRMRWGGRRAAPAQVRQRGVGSRQPRARVQRQQREHAFVGAVQLQRRGAACLVEAQREVRVQPDGLCRDPQVLQRMAQVGQHIAPAAVAVLVARALEHRGGQHQCGRLWRPDLGHRGRRRGRRSPLGDRRQRMPQRIVVPQARRQPGHVERCHVQLGGKQRARRRRRPQLVRPGAAGDAGGVPQQRGQRRQVEAARRGAVRRWQYHALVTGRLEGCGRLAPVDAGRAQHAAARVRRQLMVALDLGERGRRRHVIGRTCQRRGCVAAMAQPQPVGRAAGQRAERQADRAAAWRPARGGARRLCGTRPHEVAPDDAPVEAQVQRHQQQRGITEQVVPVEHRQLLVGDPEDAQPRRGAQVGQQQQAEADVQRMARRHAPAQQARAEQRGGNQQGQQHPQQLGHRTIMPATR